MNPSTKEEFVELSQLIVGKLSNYEVTIIHCEIIMRRETMFYQTPKHQEETGKKHFARLWTILTIKPCLPSTCPIYKKNQFSQSHKGKSCLPVPPRHFQGVVLFWFLNFLLVFVFHSWPRRMENAIGCLSIFENAYCVEYIHLTSFFFQSSADYVPFLEMLFRDLCAGCK